MFFSGENQVSFVNQEPSAGPVSGENSRIPGENQVSFVNQEPSAGPASVESSRIPWENQMSFVNQKVRWRSCVNENPREKSEELKIMQSKQKILMDFRQPLGTAEAK